MMQKRIDTLTNSLDATISYVKAFFLDRKSVLFAIVAVSIIAYGFELFNFNITIDEEIHAVYSMPSDWIAQGRWGMYLLNKFIMPYTVVPVIPLTVALIFHIFSALLLLDSWKVGSKTEQIIIGSVCVAYPGIGYMYVFSTISYGIGIGLFSAALSLWLFERNNGMKKLLAVFPAAFAIAIYQSFAVVLVCIYLVSFIVNLPKTFQQAIKHLTSISIVIVLGMFFYFLANKVLTSFIPESAYVSSYFDVNYLLTNFQVVLKKLSDLLMKIYSGDASIYAQEISALGVLLVISLLSGMISIFQSTVSLVNKVLLIILSLFLVVLPFAQGLLTRGDLLIRSLIALPVVISGLIVIGIKVRGKLFHSLILLLSILCIFQFSLSTNRLFASSHLALQADRLLAASLIDRIEEAKFEAKSQDVKYMELIGYVDRKPTKLMPISEAFGGSFFQWDLGNVNRVILFLDTIGYQGLSQLPPQRRSDFIDDANLMPSWPQIGSVKVIGDTVLVKFGPYSFIQIDNICRDTRNLSLNTEEIATLCK